MYHPSRLQDRAEGRIYFAADEDDHASPPPSRPRSNSLPVSGYRGALVRVAAAHAQAADDSSQDAMVVDVAQASSTQRVIDRLPVDVVSEILEAWSALESSYANFYGNRAAFYALAVSQTWREAAKSTHCLWARPDFCSRRMLGKPSWVEYHACFLRFGGARGFDITLDNDVAAIPLSDPVWAYFSANVLVKARSITLQIYDSAADPDVLAGRTYPLLRSLSVRFASLAPDFPEVKLYLDAPQLGQVELNKTYMAFDDYANRQTNPMWTITSLDLTRTEYAIADLAVLSEVCVVLREFALTVDALYDCPCDPFTWPTLKTLRVTAQAVHGGDELPFRIQLPNVTMLEITDNRWNWAFWRHFVDVACPALTELRVYRNHMDHAKEFVGGIGSLSNIRTLVLREGSMNEDILTRLVKPASGKPMPFPNLKTLHFQDTIPLRRFEFRLVRYALQYRYRFLGELNMPGPFILTCALKRKPKEEEENLIRGRVEQSVRDYNEEEWARYNGWD